MGGDIDTMTLEEFNAMVGVRSELTDGVRFVRAAKKLGAESAVKILPEAVSEQSESIVRYVAEDGGEFALQKTDRGYRFYDYAGDNPTVLLTEAQANEILGEIRAGGEVNAEETHDRAIADVNAGVDNGQTKNAPDRVQEGRHARKKALDSKGKRAYNNRQKYKQISREEYAVIKSSIMSKNAKFIANGEPLPKIGTVYSANYFYLYENFSEDSFGIVKQLKLTPHNQARIDNITNKVEVQNGESIVTSRRTLDRSIEILKNGKGHHSGSADADLNGRRDLPSGGVSSGESEGDGQRRARKGTSDLGEQRVNAQNAASSTTESSKQSSKKAVDVAKELRSGAWLRENVEGYGKLNATEQLRLRSLAVEARANGFSDADMLSICRVAVHSGLDISFDRVKLLTVDKDGRESYADGMYLDGVIYIDPQSERAIPSLLVHEMVHAVYGKDAGRMLRLAYRHMPKAEREAIKADYGIEEESNAEYREEIAAHYAERILGSESGLSFLWSEDENLKDKILGFFKGAQDAYSVDAKLDAAAKRFARQYRKLFGKLEETRGVSAARGSEGRKAFAGAKAATADKLKLETAEKMLAEGVDSETVRQETGWFKGYDGKWRFEIVDPIEMINTDKLYESRFTTLGELIEHPDLFAAYPDLADIQVTFEDISEGNGHYNRDFDTISLSDNYTKPFGAGGLLQTLTHEIQHAVQTREEFARGASPSKWAEKVNGGKLVEQASKKTRDIFEKAPDEFKQMVRKINRAVLDYDDALVSQMSKEIADSQYADLYIEYEAARQAERNIREIVQRGDLSPIELYYRTAGEVEARDSANRLGLTTEERKQKRPDIDRSDVVFAGDGGVSYEIKRDGDGKTYWHIETKSDIFKNCTTPQQYRDAAFEFLIKSRDNKVTVKDSNGNEVQFIRLSAEEFTNSVDSQDLFLNEPDLFKKKMQMIPSLEDILLNSNVNWHSPDLKNHNLFKQGGFENFRGRVRIDNVIFNTVVRIGVANFGEVFYDISIEVDKYLPHTKSASDINMSTSIDNSIPQNSEDVKGNDGKRFAKKKVKAGEDTAFAAAAARAVGGEQAATAEAAAPMAESDAVKQAEKKVASPQKRGKSRNGYEAKRDAETREGKVFSRRDALNTIKGIEGVTFTRLSEDTKLVDELWALMNKAMPAGKKKEAIRSVSRYIASRLLSDSAITDPDAAAAQKTLLLFDVFKERVAFKEEEARDIRRLYGADVYSRIVTRWQESDFANPKKHPRMPLAAFLADVSADIPGMAHIADMEPIRALMEVEKVYNRLSAAVENEVVATRHSELAEDIDTVAALIEESINETLENGGEKSQFSKRLESTLASRNEKIAALEGKLKKILEDDKRKNRIAREREKDAKRREQVLKARKQRDSAIARNIEIAKERIRRSEEQAILSKADSRLGKVFDKSEIKNLLSNFTDYAELHDSEKSKIANAMFDFLNTSMTLPQRREAARELAMQMSARMMLDIRLQHPDVNTAIEVLELLEKWENRIGFSSAEVSALERSVGKDGFLNLSERWLYISTELGGELDAVSMEQFISEATDSIPGMAYARDMAPIDAMLEIDKVCRRMTDVLQSGEDIQMYGPDLNTMAVAASLETDIMNAFESGGEKSKVSKMLESVLDNAEERVLFYKNLKSDEEAKHKAIRALVKKAEALKDRQIGRYKNAADGQSENFAGLLSRLARVINNNGSLNVSGTREIMGDLASWYATNKETLFEYEGDGNTGFFSQEILDKMLELSSGSKNYTADELLDLYEVLCYFDNFTKNYGKIWRAGKRVEALPLAQAYCEIARENEILRKDIWTRQVFKKYESLFGDPMSLMRYMDCYNERGFYTEMLQELREAAKNAEIEESRILAAYDEFMKKNKKYVQNAEAEVLEFDGEKISRMQLIQLYMSFKRGQAQAGLLQSGYVFDSADGKRHTVRGILFNPDSKPTAEELRQAAADRV